MKIGLRSGLYSRNLSDSLGDVRTMYIASNPTFEEFQNGEYILKFWEEDNPIIKIRVSSFNAFFAGSALESVTCGCEPGGGATWFQQCPDVCVQK